MLQNMLGVDIVIVYYIGGFDHLHLFQALYPFQELQLGIHRYPSRYPIRVNDIVIKTFRLQPNVVAITLWKTF